MNDKRRKLVEDNLGLVEKVAGILVRRSRIPSHVPREDLVSWGNVGLVDAAQRFDFSRGGKFSTFAFCRIWGAIMDGLRSHDIIPRKMRSRIKKGLHPDFQVLSMYEPENEKSTAPIYNLIESGKKSLAETAADSDAVAEIFRSTPAECRKVMHWYFFDELTLQEIALKLGVSESRSSQLIRAAITNVRAALCPHMVGRPVRMLFHRSRRD